MSTTYCERLTFPMTTWLNRMDSPAQKIAHWGSKSDLLWSLIVCKQIVHTRDSKFQSQCCDFLPGFTWLTDPMDSLAQFNTSTLKCYIYCLSNTYVMEQRTPYGPFFPLPVWSFPINVNSGISGRGYFSGAYSKLAKRCR